MTCCENGNQPVFPRSQHWSPQLWESWTSQVDEKHDKWDSVLKSAENIQPHQTGTRMELDHLWNIVELELKTISCNFQAKRVPVRHKRSREEYNLWRKVMNHARFQRECVGQAKGYKEHISVFCVKGPKNSISLASGKKHR